MKPIRSIECDWVYGPHPEEARRAAPSRRMEHGAALPVAVLRDARGACHRAGQRPDPLAGSSGRGRYDSNFEFAELVPRHSDYDWLILSQSRMGKSFGATRIWMLLATPG